MSNYLQQLNLENRMIAKSIVARTTVNPVFRLFDKAFPERVVVHVLQLVMANAVAFCVFLADVQQKFLPIRIKLP